MDGDHSDEIADLKARLLGIENQKPFERIGRLERFQTGVTWGLGLISAMIGFLADTIRKKLGL